VNIDEAEEEQQEEEQEEEQPAEESEYPRAEDCYLGMYVTFRPQSKEGQGTMTSAECAIGAKVDIVFPDSENSEGDAQDDDREKVDVPTFVGRSGGQLAPVPDKEAATLQKLHDEGWDIEAVLSLVMYRQKDHVFSGEVAIFCYDSQMENVSAIVEFKRQSIKRIKGGDHPKISLHQKNFEKVLSSNGEWFMTKGEPLPKLGKGEAYFKKRQTATDKMVDMSIEHRAGCTVASTAGLVVIVLLIIGLIWIF
jgi:hypothetical protein